MAEVLLFQAAPSWGLLCRDSKVALSCEKQDFLTISFGSRMPYWPGQNLLRTLPLSKMLLTQSSFFSSLLHKSHLLTLASSSNPPIFLSRCFIKKSSIVVYLFILNMYLFWLLWVFLAVPGLALFAASGGQSLVAVEGFSLRWLFFMRNTGSKHVGLSSCGGQTQLSHSMWNLPRPGIELLSLALQGTFLTTGLPGKPSHHV